jgi:hypothetical protein
VKRKLAFTVAAWLLACAVAGGSTIPGFRYVYPIPESRFASPSTTIILRPENPSVLARMSPRSVSASGSRSGSHPGRLVLSDDRKTLIFSPASPFFAGEDVTVTLDGSLVGNSGDRTQYHFGVNPREQQAGRVAIESSPTANRLSPGVQPAVKAQRARNKVRLAQGTEPPPITVDINTAPSEGCVFISSFSVIDSSSPYLLIVDNAGNLVFSQARPAVCYDFRVQPNGLITYFDTGRGYYVALDNNFAEIDSFLCGNGVLTTDEHELILLPDGHALIMGRVDVPVDMSTLVEGGQSGAYIIGLVVQELDQSRNVVFQWNSWDHYAITDADGDIDLTQMTIDCVHGNAVELDYDGNIFISARNMDEVTKISRETGEILWRLGGEQNQFTFVNDTLRFSWQHDARRLPNGHLTVFDNGVDRDPIFSRVVEYELDEVNKIATLVWEYRSEGMYSYYMGNAQRLPDGNTLIGWGGTTGASVTEVTPAGTKVWEISLPPATYSYRAFRFPCVTPPQPWTLTATAPHGHVVRKPDYPTYANGASVELTAVADRGYTFVRWTGDIESTANPLLMTIDGNKTVQAECAAVTNAVTVTEGWNLLSVPVVPDDPGVNSCFPDAVSQAFMFRDGYKETQELSVGTGYWLKCSGGNTTTIGGTLHGSGEIPVTLGWNMIGPCEQEIATSAILSDPPGITVSAYYDYSGGYQEVATLSPGKGYWIKSSAEGTLRVVDGAAKVQAAEGPAASSWTVVDFKDAHGRQGTLRIGPSREISRSYELPPLPPSGSMDVRFGSGTSVEPAEIARHEILLHGMESPVSIRITNLNRKTVTLSDAIDGSLLNVHIGEGETVTISQALEKLILSEEAASTVVPGECTLEQNYPNPCNPATGIRFQVSELSRVSLKVYDLLGREVATLVDGERPQGVYRVQFEASGLASGIYFYRMTAGPFTAVKKLMIVR